MTFIMKQLQVRRSQWGSGSSVMCILHLYISTYEHVTSVIRLIIHLQLEIGQIYSM